MYQKKESGFTLPSGEAFEAELLAQGSTRQQSGTRARRWTEFAVYRRREGGYVTHEVGRSTIDGETDRHRIRHRERAEDLLEDLESRGRPRLVVSDVLAAAASRDASISEALGDRLDIEDLPGDSEDGIVFVLDRDNERALRFHGRRLALESSRVEEDQLSWTEIAVYQASTLQYAVHKVQRSLHEREPRRAAAWVVGTGRAALEALILPDRAWFESTAYNALAAAADASPHFEETLDGLLDENRFMRLVGTKPRLGPIDSRRDILEVLASGARLVTKGSSNKNKATIVGWRSEVEVSIRPPSQRQFYRLSRERLISRVSSVTLPPASEVVEWDISRLGREVLKAVHLKSDNGPEKRHKTAGS